MNDPILNSQDTNDKEIVLEIDDVSTSHIEVRDYRMSFVQFIESARKVEVTDKQWTIIVSLLECCRAIHNAVEINLDENLRLANIQFLEQLELIECNEKGILATTRPGAGALLLLELICGIALGVSLVFEDTYTKLKLKKPIPLPELSKKFRKEIDKNKAVLNKGFGSNRNKSMDSLTMLVHPILNEEHFTYFLGILSESNYIYSYMCHGYNREPDYIATVDGYMLEAGEAEILPYYEKEPEEELFHQEFKVIFDYATSVGISKPRYSNDAFESYFVNLQYFLDNILPLYLNSPLVSKKYRKVCERIDRSYIIHCQANLQESLMAMVVNKLDDFLLNNSDDDVFVTVVNRIRSRRLSAIKSIGKLIGLPPNWTKVLTSSSISQITNDFIDIVDFVTVTDVFEEVEVPEQELESEDDVLSTDDICSIKVALQADQVIRTTLFNNSLIQVDQSLLKKNHYLELNSINRLLDKLESMINHLSIKLQGVVTTKSIMQYALTPNVFQGEVYMTSKRFEIFASNEPPLAEDDLEIKLGSASRLFLRDEGQKLKVVFLGNPDYH
jgi:hypothetical protein